MGSMRYWDFTLTCLTYILWHRLVIETFTVCCLDSWIGNCHYPKNRGQLKSFVIQAKLATWKMILDIDITCVFFVILTIFCIQNIEVAPGWKPPSLFCARIMFTKSFRSPKNIFFWISPLNYGNVSEFLVPWKNTIYSIISHGYYEIQHFLLVDYFFGCEQLPLFGSLVLLSSLRLWPCPVLEKLGWYLGVCEDFWPRLPLVIHSGNPT